MDEREKLDAPSGDVERVHNALLNIRAICDREVYEGRNNGTLDHIHGFAVAGLSTLSAMPRQAGINEGLEMAAKDKAAEFWFSLGFAACYGRLDKPPFPLEDWRGAFDHVEEAYDGDLAEDFAAYIATVIEAGQHLGEQ